MRIAEVERKTAETQIKSRVNVDGTGRVQIVTGVGFIDHLLSALTFHAQFDLDLEAHGDQHVDNHHTVEDCALVLGRALDQALQERKWLHRFASVHLPMDEALAFVALDLSGRPYAVVQAKWNGPSVGGIATSLVPHFLESFAFSARTTLHASVVYGRDDHHKSEALFKALGVALRSACGIDKRRGVASTKGTLT